MLAVAVSNAAVGASSTPAAPAPPAWTVLTPDPVQPLERRGAEQHVPASERVYTLQQIDDGSNPPDWFPQDHPSAPDVVAHGTPGVPGCALCHLYSGEGHPESANLAGQPGEYLTTQLADYKSGARVDPARMSAIGKALSAEDAQLAASWFSSLQPTVWFRAVESARVPKTRITQDHLRVRLAGGETEPLGERIVEMAADADLALNRDPRSGFVSYVPVGSIAKGKLLASNGVDGRSVACADCHGAHLEGVGAVPRIAGLSAVYVARQLAGFRGTARNGAAAQPMKVVAARLTQSDLLFLSAYLVSLPPR
jgi:cytochrome c553